MKNISIEEMNSSYDDEYRIVNEDGDILAIAYDRCIAATIKKALEIGLNPPSNTPVNIYVKFDVDERT